MVKSAALNKLLKKRKNSEDPGNKTKQKQVVKNRLNRFLYC